jgi:hypothetical protein
LLLRGRGNGCRAIAQILRNALALGFGALLAPGQVNRVRLVVQHLRLDAVCTTCVIKAIVDEKAMQASRLFAQIGRVEAATARINLLLLGGTLLCVRFG